jgi:hypothetical protein
MKKSILKNLIRECLVENKSEYDGEDIKRLSQMTDDESPKSEYDTNFVTYLRQMTGEEPFMMGGKKFEYVWAKYPSGKRDIGVYSFAGDVVYGYNYFRKMYNLDAPADPQIRESIGHVGKKTHFYVNKTDLSAGSRDPEAEREIVYQIMRVTSDPSGDDYEEIDIGMEYYDEGKAKAVAAELNQKLAAGQIKEDVEHFSKTVKGTVEVSGVEYAYEGTVTGNIVGTPQPHGEFHSEIDESSVEIDITRVTPEPPDEHWEMIDSAVFDDVMGKNLWDFVNEIDDEDDNLEKMFKDDNLDTVEKQKDFEIRARISQRDGRIGKMNKEQPLSETPKSKSEKVIDITGKKCVKCKKGTYGETSIHSDMHGTKSCSSCGHTLPTNSTKSDLLKEFEGEANKDMCIKCKREILPSETRHRMPMSGLCQHIPSCPTDPPMGEKPHDRDVRLGKLKENGSKSTGCKVDIVFELIMDNFFEENAHLKADDLVFWAIQSVGSYNRHKLVKHERFGEKRIFKFEATLDTTDQVKRVVDLLNSEHHVKKIVVLSIKHV